MTTTSCGRAARSPTLLVLGAAALLLLWSAAAGWSCRPRVRPCGLLRRPRGPAPVPAPAGRTHIVQKPVASHNLNNREIHALAKTSEGGLRGVFGPVADMNRSMKCICTRPFCQHPQGQAQEGHEEVQLTPAQQDLYYASEYGWACDDMLFPKERDCTIREPSDADPPPSNTGVDAAGDA